MFNASMMTIHCVVFSVMTLFVKTVRETFEIKVNSSDLIMEVKTKIQEVKDMQPRLQKLFFLSPKSMKFIALEDERSLSSYSIKHKSTLPLVFGNNRLQYEVFFS